MKRRLERPGHPGLANSESGIPLPNRANATAAATVLAALFPRDRESLLAHGKEAAEARVWAGIHYRFDIDAGQERGRKVAGRVLARTHAGASNPGVSNPPTPLNSPDSDTAFAGSIPELYERYLVPLIFEPYAADLARRVAARAPARVLETAAGTGVVTRQLASSLPAGVSIVATDLNQPMIGHAATVGTMRPVEWRRADAMQLPFPDDAFDVVACQFGVMFFPDKAKAFAEARRVLRPGGALVFNVWDRIEVNQFADAVTGGLEPLFPANPPRFLARVPHGYHDPSAIARDLAQGGFDRSPEITTLAARSRADSARVPAVAYCQGTPLRNEIEARGPSRLGEATDAATAAIAKRFGAGAVESGIQAHVITIER